MIDYLAAAFLLLTGILLMLADSKVDAGWRGQAFVRASVLLMGASCVYGAWSLAFG
jgi:hypothetical protein